MFFPGFGYGSFSRPLKLKDPAVVPVELVCLDLCGLFGLAQPCAILDLNFLFELPIRGQVLKKYACEGYRGRFTIFRPIRTLYYRSNERRSAYICTRVNNYNADKAGDSACVGAVCYTESSFHAPNANYGSAVTAVRTLHLLTHSCWCGAFNVWSIIDIAGRGFRSILFGRDGRYVK